MKREMDGIIYSEQDSRIRFPCGELLTRDQDAILRHSRAIEQPADGDTRLG